MPQGSSQSSTQPYSPYPSLQFFSQCSAEPQVYCLDSLASQVPSLVRSDFLVVVVLEDMTATPIVLTRVGKKKRLEVPWFADPLALG